MATVYITKYALTKGIQKYEGHLDLYIRYWECSHDSFPNGSAIFQFNDGYFSEQSAIERCEQLRDAKIKSLEKQIEKLKTMTWG